MRFYIKTILLIFIFLFILMNITNVSAQDWWDIDWGNRKEIDIENVGGSSLLNYTAYIKVIKTNSMQSDYDDLRFVYNGNLLDHEIGYYNDTYCDCYVRIPNFNDTGISLYMYYNNPSANGLDLYKEAWDDDAVRINHMEDTSGMVIFDSTEYYSDVIQIRSILGQEGIISNGLYMRRDLGDWGSNLVRSDNIPFDDEMTFSTWINTNYSDSGIEYILGRYFGYYKSYTVIYSEGVIELCIIDSENSPHCIDYTFSPGEFNDSRWHMISGYLNDSYMKLYFDSIELNSTNGGFVVQEITTYENFLHGYRIDDYAYEGYLDETKVFKKSFDEGWHKQEYEIIINQSNIVEFGVEENKPLSIFTLPAENIDTDKATLRGVTNMGSCLIWFGWSPTVEKYLFWDKLLYFPEPETEIKYNIYDLLPGVEYKFNIFAFCGNKFYIGNESSFTTTGSLRLN